MNPHDFVTEVTEAYTAVADAHPEFKPDLLGAAFPQASTPEAHVPVDICGIRRAYSRILMTPNHSWEAFISGTSAQNADVQLHKIHGEGTIKDALEVAVADYIDTLNSKIAPWLWKDFMNEIVDTALVGVSSFYQELRQPQISFPPRVVTVYADFAPPFSFNANRLRWWYNAERWSFAKFPGSSISPRYKFSELLVYWLDEYGSNIWNPFRFFPQREAPDDLRWWWDVLIHRWGFTPPPGIMPFPDSAPVTVPYVTTPVSASPVRRRRRGP